MKEKENILKLVQQLIQIDSSDPGALEQEIGIFIKNWLLTNAPGVSVKTKNVRNQRQNLYARIPGKISHPALVLICHMDTVVLGSGWKKAAPLSGSLIENRLYGRGSCDMKSGLACAMYAFARAARQKAQGHLPEHSLVFLASVDEEDFMRGAEAAIDDGWVTKEDWVLDMEPTNGKIRMAHKGRTWFEVSVEGVTAHASTPYKGADAIAGIAEIIHQIRQDIQKAPIHQELGNSTVTFGMIQGGYRPYVVPDHAKVWIDMRLVPPITPKKAEQIIQNAILQGEAQIPGIRGSYVITGNRPYIESNYHSPLFQYLCQSVEQVTKKVPSVDVFPGYTDTAVIAGILQNPNCMSYGPGNLELAHKPDEYVDIQDIFRCKQVLFDLTDRILYKNFTETEVKI